MSTSSSYPGPGNDPYGTPSQPDAAGNNPHPQAYPPAGQYPSQPYGAQGYPAAGAYGAAPAARPGMVTAAAVIAFVAGGLGLIGGLIALTTLGTLSYLVGSTPLYTIFTILGLAVAAAYIWTGLQALQGKNAKFLVYTAIADVALRVLSLIVFFFAALGLIGTLIAIAIVALLLQQPSKAWFRSKGAPTF